MEICCQWSAKRSDCTAVAAWWRVSCAWPFWSLSLISHHDSLFWRQTKRHFFCRRISWNRKCQRLSLGIFYRTVRFVTSNLSAARETPAVLTARLRVRYRSLATGRVLDVPTHQTIDGTEIILFAEKEKALVESEYRPKATMSVKPNGSLHQICVILQRIIK